MTLLLLPHLSGLHSNAPIAACKTEIDANGLSKNLNKTCLDPLKAPGPPTPDPPRPNPLPPRPPPVPTPPPSPRNSTTEYLAAITIIERLAVFVCGYIVPLVFPRPVRPPTPGPRPGPVGPRPNVPTPPPSPRRAVKTRTTLATVSIASVLPSNTRQDQSTGAAYHVDTMPPGNPQGPTPKNSFKRPREASGPMGNKKRPARHPRQPTQQAGFCRNGPPMWACCEICEKGPRIRDQPPIKIIVSQPVDASNGTRAVAAGDDPQRQSSLVSHRTVGHQGEQPIMERGTSAACENFDIIGLSAVQGGARNTA